MNWQIIIGGFFMGIGVGAILHGLGAMIGRRRAK